MTKVVLLLVAAVLVIFASYAHAAPTVAVVRCAQAPVEAWSSWPSGGYTVRVYRQQNNSKKLYAQIKISNETTVATLFDGMVAVGPGWTNNSVSYSSLGFNLSVSRGAYGLGEGNLTINDGFPWGTGNNNTGWPNTNPGIHLNCRWGR